MLKDFDNDIKKVAFKCGLIDYYQCSQIINKGLNIENLYELNGVDTIINQLITNLEAQYSNISLNNK